MSKPDPLPRLEGETCILAPFTDDFVSPAYLGWLKDDETTRWLVKAGPDMGLDEVRAFCRQMMDSPDDCFFAILLREDGRHVGNLRVGPIDWAAGVARFGVMIGDGAVRGKGLGTELMGLVERFCFATLGLVRMRFPVVAAHGGAMRMYEKAGYAVDGSWPEDFVKDGRTWPMVAMTKTRRAA